MDTASFSRAVLTKLIRKQVLEIAQDRKKKSVLFIDEISLLRLQVLAELHTITQFQRDSKPILSIILAGQHNLADLFIYKASLPLASRQVSKRTSFLIKPSPPYSRAPVASSKRPTT
ncbi:hypothetical protein DFAR_3650012 [Desulfarculales bacterium]